MCSLDVKWSCSCVTQNYIISRYISVLRCIPYILYNQTRYEPHYQYISCIFMDLSAQIFIHIHIQISFIPISILAHALLTTKIYAYYWLFIHRIMWISKDLFAHRLGFAEQWQSTYVFFLASIHVSAQELSEQDKCRSKTVDRRSCTGRSQEAVVIF